MKKNENQINEENKEIIQAQKISWFDKIPFWVKAIVIKYWFFGMTYFFFISGLAYFFQSFYANYPPVFWIIAGVATGFFNDFMVYNILDAIDGPKPQWRYWVMFKSKKIYSTFINLAYGIGWSCLTFYICGELATVFMGWFGDGCVMFREAFSFALVGFIVDAILVGIKDLIVYAFRRNKVTKEDLSV